ncbi:MAG: guanylate kinase [Spirochaetes bacterium GWC1_27_15]|nr:MAG: guanylate kinase [Spirochaetes bacterium GWC1_27_15]
MSTNGELIIISGPSGVGKSTLLKKLLEKYNDKLCFSVSYTSRKSRVGEVHGVDYHFVSQEEFKKGIEQNVFIEWALVHDNYYGTSKHHIEEIINCGKICILDIDVQGAMNLMNNNVKAKYVFIAPPSIESLKERLLKRSTDSLAVIEKRIKNAEKELSLKDRYQYIVINDNFDNAFNQLENIIIRGG